MTGKDADMLMDIASQWILVPYVVMIEYLFSSLQSVNRLTEKSSMSHESCYIRKNLGKFKA